MDLKQLLRNRYREEEWVQDVMVFLTSLETTLLAGETHLPNGLMKQLHWLIHGKGSTKTKGTQSRQERET